MPNVQGLLNLTSEQRLLCSHRCIRSSLAVSNWDVYAAPWLDTNRTASAMTIILHYRNEKEGHMETTQHQTPTTAALNQRPVTAT
jgi:hypothetical protein